MLAEVKRKGVAKRGEVVFRQTVVIQASGAASVFLVHAFGHPAPVFDHAPSPSYLMLVGKLLVTSGLNRSYCSHHPPSPPAFVLHQNRGARLLLPEQTCAIVCRKVE